MFGLSTWEILLILAVALIFIGPDQLPKVAKQIGKGVRQVRGAVDKVDGEMRRVVREATDEDDDDDDAPTRKVATAAPLEAKVQDATLADAKTANAAPVVPVVHDARDWSAVGKAPVEGRVEGRPAVHGARAHAAVPAREGDDAAPPESTSSPASDDKPTT